MNTNLELPNTEIPGNVAQQLGLAFGHRNHDMAPETMLDWAIHWASQGIHVFPCKSFLGTPIPPRWHASATTDISRLVEWWSEHPDADIAAVPDRSGHFVIAAIGNKGHISLQRLEQRYGALAPSLITETLWGHEHLWLKGSALSSRDRLGPGLRVLGAGTFVYMPASLAPDPD